MTIDIKKATITGSIFLAYEFDQVDLDVRNNIKTKSDAPIHDDLRNAFRRLIPHYASVCEEVRDQELVAKAIGSPDAYLMDKETSLDDTFFKYRVYGFSVRDNKGATLLQISGSKKLENGKEISFSTYDIDLDDPEYMYVGELKEAVDDLKAEVLAYMQGKSAPKAQMEMFVDEEDLEEADL